MQESVYTARGMSSADLPPGPPDALDTDIGPSITAIEHPQQEEAVGGVTVSVPASSSGDDVSLYQLKWIQWKDGFTPIITQNENGPCPLLALCNVLLLSGRLKLPTGETIVSSTHLLDLLGACLIENGPKDLTAGETANYEQNVQDAMAIFPKLQTGLDVNVTFNSVSGFEFTSESGVFDLLGVRLFHGWLPDPQETQTHKAIAGCSYNQLVERVISDRQATDPDKLQNALLAEQFLESTASQLTYHGLCELNSTVLEGELCVFFRNNHFSSLLKKSGRLLLLVTDLGFLNELGYVWETLTDIDGGGDFLDAQFHWSPQSDTQCRQEKREEGEVGGGRKETHPTQTRLDYQIALSMQQEERVEPAGGHILSRPLESHTPSPQHSHGSDLALAIQLQQDELSPGHTPNLTHQPPPTSREEYEREASHYHHTQGRGRRNENCSLV